MAELAFMIFSITLLIFVVWMVEAAEERWYQRKVNEFREFGRVVIDQDSPPPKHSKNQ